MFSNVVNYVTPGQSTNSCLQLCGIFIIVQRSFFKHHNNK